MRCSKRLLKSGRIGYSRLCADGREGVVVSVPTMVVVGNREYVPYTAYCRVFSMDDDRLQQLRPGGSDNAQHFLARSWHVHPTPEQKRLPRHGLDAGLAGLCHAAPYRSFHHADGLVACTAVTQRALQSADSTPAHCSLPGLIFLACPAS